MVRQVVGRCRFLREMGFSLVEGLVAMGILIMGGVVILNTLSFSFVAFSKSRNTHMAIQIAREKLEEWRREGHEWIVGQPDTVTGTLSTSLETAGGVQNTRFDWTVTHQPIVADGIEQIHVTVSWIQNMNAGSVNSVRLTTWVKHEETE